MSAAAPQRQDVMNLCRFGQPAFLPALFAQRMRRKEPVAYPFPLTACVQFPYCFVAAVPVVLLVCQLLMFLAVPFFRQPGTAREAAWPLWFPWQRLSPPNVICNVATCLMLFRNLPTLLTRWQLILCCACLCPACLQDAALSDVAPNHAHVVGKIASCPVLCLLIPSLSATSARFRA